MAEQATQATIEVNDLVKHYGSVAAVKGVSFKVNKGEIVGFLGPNGAGKSTVMKVLTCFLSATSGRIKVAGHDVYRSPLEVRRRVGYQPESVPLYDEMVVYDYLLFMAKMRGVKRARRRERIETVARQCGLQAVMSKLVRELSKGYRQRVGLAQALVHDPEVLILDEPMSGLDPNQIIEIRDLIRDIGRQKTVIFSSHILQEIEKLCDRVLVIHQGELVCDGTVAELTEQVSDGRCFALELAASDLELATVLDQLEAAQLTVSSSREGDGVLVLELLGSAPDLKETIGTLAQRHRWIVLKMVERVFTLEDIFKKLTSS